MGASSSRLIPTCVRRRENSVMMESVIAALLGIFLSDCQDFALADKNRPCTKIGYQPVNLLVTFQQIASRSVLRKIYELQRASSLHIDDEFLNPLFSPHSSP